MGDLRPVIQSIIRLSYLTEADDGADSRERLAITFHLIRDEMRESGEAGARNGGRCAAWTEV